MATSGNRPSCINRDGALTPADTGYAPIMAGLGFPKNPSDGQLITMGVGHCSAATDGSGCRVTNGHPHGSHGVRAGPTSAGHHCLPKPWPIRATAGAQVWKSASASDHCGSASSNIGISDAPSVTITCRSQEIAISSATPPTSPTFTCKTTSSQMAGRTIELPANVLAGIFHFTASIWTAKAVIAIGAMPASQAIALASAPLKSMPIGMMR